MDFVLDDLLFVTHLTFSFCACRASLSKCQIKLRLGHVRVRYEFGK
jgi:hypothetical protein